VTATAGRPGPFTGVAVAGALNSAVIALGAAGVDTPRLDAEVLLAWALGVTRTALVLDPDRPVEGVAVRRFSEAVRRRSAQREPVAYITAIKAFRHIELEVDPRVLIPRPETELLVEVGLQAPPGTRVHDLGTGSGAVALALKHERPDLIVSASDLSPDALEVARANARRLGLEVALHPGDWEQGLDGGAKLVLANPPYVAEADRPSLAPELRHEPPQALFAGPDGLAALRAIAEALGRRPAPDGPSMVALEVGQGQAAAVGELLAVAGFARQEQRRDLAGVERVVVAWRR
jgi:release factor glutamine methyltransferase